MYKLLWRSNIEKMTLIYTNVIVNRENEVEAIFIKSLYTHTHTHRTCANVSPCVYVKLHVPICVPDENTTYHAWSVSTLFVEARRQGVSLSTELVNLASLAVQLWGSLQSMKGTGTPVAILPSQNFYGS